MFFSLSFPFYALYYSSRNACSSYNIIFAYCCIPNSSSCACSRLAAMHPSTILHIHKIFPANIKQKNPRKMHRNDGTCVLTLTAYEQHTKITAPKYRSSSAALYPRLPCHRWSFASQTCHRHLTSLPFGVFVHAFLLFVLLATLHLLCSRCEAAAHLSSLCLYFLPNLCFVLISLYSVRFVLAFC